MPQAGFQWRWLIFNSCKRIFSTDYNMFQSYVYVVIREGGVKSYNRFSIIQYIKFRKTRTSKRCNINACTLRYNHYYALLHFWRSIVSFLCFKMFLSVRTLFCRCKHQFVYRCACTEDKNTGNPSLFNVNSLHSHVRKVSIIWEKQCMKAYNIFLLWLRIKLLVFIAFKFIFISIFKRLIHKN